MAKTVPVTIRLDKNINERADQVFDSMGLNLSTAVNIFIRQALRENKIPFQIGIPVDSENEQEILKESIAQDEAGRTTADESLED